MLHIVKVGGEIVYQD